MTKKQVLSTAALLALVVVVVMFAAGKFGGPRVAPGRGPELPGQPAPAASAPISTASEEVFEDAVGTVHSRRRVVVAAEASARVVEVVPRVGDDVRRGDALIRLDDRELTARAAESRQALAAAEAAREQAAQAKVQGLSRLTLATSRHDRVKSFFDRGAATLEQVEAAEADLAQAGAGVADADAAIAMADARIAQAKQVVNSAGISLGHTVIAAPLDGVIAERMVEPGDLGWPGRPLLVVLDPQSLRLEAQVREGLLPAVQVGSTVAVEVPAALKSLVGKVAEVVPAGDPRSRTFEVRIDIPADPAVRPGMYGRVRFPVARRDVVRVPAASIRRVGQLETVLVRDGDAWHRRLVTTGAPTEDGSIEILSGLSGGETVGLGAGSER